MLRTYLNNFKGFSFEIWILTLISFINRAGTMVIPFLSRYMKEGLSFSYDQIGWVMVAFGVGSLLGSWLGGKLTDYIGFYKIMIGSLLTTGVLFVLLQFVTTFYMFCLAIFILMSIADMFRPAIFIAINSYARPENNTRAITLVRLAVNLGFAAGPAFAGVLISFYGYAGLFWVDGISCILAILIFGIFVKEKNDRKKITKKDTKMPKISVFKDRTFCTLLLVVFLIAVTFFQIFTIFPLYQAHLGWSTASTGYYLAINGFLVFLFEMAVVSHYERKKTPKSLLLVFACLLLVISYILMIVGSYLWLLIIVLVLLSFSEIFGFPSGNVLTLRQAPKGYEGIYMGYFSMAFSMAHIMATKISTTIIEDYGYTTNWFFMLSLALIGFFLALSLYKKKI